MYQTAKNKITSFYLFSFLKYYLYIFENKNLHENKKKIMWGYIFHMNLEFAE